MCGIAGFIEQDLAERDSDGQLRRMLARITHRGPDGEGVHAENGFAMGMRRLSIIDLEGGGQPIWNEDQTVGVVFNGEIYNYLEIRRDLETRGHSFRTSSDTEVLVHLYEECGETMLSRLRGMFAFAILDRARRSILVARDHFGQKPLYYTSAPGRFAFASEMKSLFAVPWVRRELSDVAFLDYASWLSLPPPRTHFEHIHKLAAGSFLRLSLDLASTPIPQKYWRYELDQTPDLTDENEAAEALDAALKDSLRVHLRADVPLGVLLSGGLDSRTVVAYAQELTDGAMQTFTVGFGSGDSELLGAAETAREIRSTHHTLELDSAGFSSAIDRIAEHLDEPVGDPACFAVMEICRFARDHVKVLLSGEGSDELFGGYGRYGGMLSTLRRSDFYRGLGAILPHPDFSGASRWQRFLQRVSLSRAAETLLLRSEGLPGDTRSPRGFTSSQLAGLLGRAEKLSPIVRKQRDELSALLALDLDWQLAESLLQKADKMSMGASIELRTPILDIEVAKVAARIPSSLKLHESGVGKYILRKTLGRKLNEDMTRPKKGFPVPLDAWFAGPLREQIEGTLFASGSAVCTKLERPLLRRAWDDYLAGKWEGRYAFYALWLYETWHRSFHR
jgi:asparagine synthase (glutamine-hydrolysing)